MHFDDRLATVLRLRAQGAALTRIQYRQLLDLLGTQPSDARGENVEAAYQRLAELSDVIPAAERAKILRDKAMRLRSPRLVAALSATEPMLAGAAIDAAKLDPAEWTDLLPALPPTARARLGTRADLIPMLTEQLARLGVARPGLPPTQSGAMATPADAAAPAPEPITKVDDDQNDGSISAIVKRIEAYRKARAPEATGQAPQLPLDEEHVLHVPAEARAFDFATNANGQIVWADPGVAPMVIGQPLAGPAAAEVLLNAVTRRQPIRGARIDLAGSPAIAGAWRIDASPRFDPLSGQFLGHQGRMRRWPSPAAVAPASSPDSEAERIRQLLHELRTPVNAIQGFSEVIQQQLFGPTPHEYRALAAGIAGDAARMLAAFEELERLARLESAAMELEPGEADLAEVLAATIAQLAVHTGQRGSGFSLEGPSGPCPVALARLELERLAWRLLATLAGTAAPGEQLPIAIEPGAAGLRVALGLPAGLASQTDQDLFEAAPGAIPQAISAGVFGVGFALRLARAEARAAGGDLVRTDDRLVLDLPGLTAPADRHSQAV